MNDNYTNKNKEEYLDISQTGLNLSLAKDEKFKQYPENERYWVSNYGQVIYLSKKGIYQVAKITADTAGKRIKLYQRIRINNNTEYLHRVVAKTWCKGYSELCNEVHHLDGDGTNNYYKNLKWVCIPHHGFLNQGTQLFFMGNRENSDFEDVDDLTIVADKIGVDVRVLGYILSRKPDTTSGGLDIYNFETSGSYPYVIALERKRNDKSAA